MFERIFFDLNTGVAALTLFVQWRNYRNNRRGKRMPMSTAKEAIDFVMHFCISLWWLLGCCLIALWQLRPFWLLLWLGIGVVAMKIIMRLVDISGVSIYIAAGAATAEQLYEARMAELTTTAVD